MHSENGQEKGEVEWFMDFLLWVPIFLVQGRGLVFDPQGGASPASPPPLPMCGRKGHANCSLPHNNNHPNNNNLPSSRT